MNSIVLWLSLTVSTIGFSASLTDIELRGYARRLNAGENCSLLHPLQQADFSHCSPEGISVLAQALRPLLKKTSDCASRSSYILELIGDESSEYQAYLWSKLEEGTEARPRRGGPNSFAVARPLESLLNVTRLETPYPKKLAALVVRNALGEINRLAMLRLIVDSLPAHPEIEAVLDHTAAANWADQLATYFEGRRKGSSGRNGITAWENRYDEAVRVAAVLRGNATSPTEPPLASDRAPIDLERLMAVATAAVSRDESEQASRDEARRQLREWLPQLLEMLPDEFYDACAFNIAMQVLTTHAK